jgi:pimeloyl-ACP methyl ester carboxylesterase
VPAIGVDGVELAYEERGGGAPVLLVHGTGGALWDPLPELLAEQHRTIWYHRRSFGDSVHEPLSDLPRHTRDAAALIEGLGAAPAIVVGHSMGGVIAIDLAIRRPELVRALVLVEPPLHFTMHPSESMQRELGKAMELRASAGDEPAAEHFMRWATTTTDGWNGFELTTPEDRAHLLGNSSAIVHELEGGTGDHISEEELAGIACPLICLVGAITLPEYMEAARRIEAALPSLELVSVPGGSHVLHVTHPQAVADAVSRISGDPAVTS